jgi:hypothetical protein
LTGSISSSSSSIVTVRVTEFLSPTVFPVNVYLFLNGIVALGFRGYQKAEERIKIIEI